MSKMYRMKDLGIEALVGRYVKSAKINGEKDLVVLDTDKGILYLTWEGSCCSRCYLENVSGVEYLVESTILSAENSTWDLISGERCYEVAESMGTNIKTSKGWVNFETRLEHNGYYSGEIKVSDDEPMDQYSSPRYEDKSKFPELKDLNDF